MKKLNKKWLACIPLAIIVGILYYMFRDIYMDIWVQIKGTDAVYLVVLLVLGLLYMLLEAVPYTMLIQRKVPDFSLWKAMQICFLGMFLNVTTLGAGIKPGQAYVLNKKGVDVGNGIAMLTLPYVFHKLAIIIYATICLIFNNQFIRETYQDTYHYLYAGYGISLLVIVALVVVCASSKVHELIFYPFDHYLKNEKIIARKDIVKNELNKLREEAENILINRTLGIKIILIDLLKISCWYCIPYIAFQAVNGSTTGISLFNVLSTASFMQLIVGVIPVTTGIGPTEVVYLLIFGVYFGKVTAGATMLLYRFSTYYFPFLLSIPLSFGLRRDIINKKRKTD